MPDKTEIPRKKRFSFACRQNGRATDLGPGDTGDDVWALQAFLTQMGYLGRTAVPGTMCPSTCDALVEFQQCYGLEQTGRGDQATLSLIEKPRCGVPDIVDRSKGVTPAAFRTVDCKYPRTDLTYAILNATPDLDRGRQREIITEAFLAWEVVTALTFREVTLAENPTFTIGWHRGNHGDGTNFDNGGMPGGNILAHAFFPPPCGGSHAGALHFDEFEAWADASAPNGVRLLNVAIHEIGHLLGLAHSNEPNAIMYALYSVSVDRLSADDIAGVQQLYGPPA